SISVHRPRRVTTCPAGRSPSTFLARTAPRVQGEGSPPFPPTPRTASVSAREQLSPARRRPPGGNQTRLQPFPGVASLTKLRIAASLGATKAGAARSCPSALHGRLTVPLPIAATAFRPSRGGRRSSLAAGPARTPDRAQTLGRFPG